MTSKGVDPVSSRGASRTPHDVSWRIGVLAGTGTVLKRTLPALLASTDCRVTVMHGRDPDRLRAVAAVDPTIRLAASEAQFAELRPYYDVVFIGSPPFLHLPHLELAFRLGTPVICEKPLTARRADYPRLAGLLGAGGLPFALAHQVRHQQAVAELSRLISCGDLGAPVAADLHWCFLMNHAASNARWKLDPTLGGSNAMFDCGVHAIDLALLLFGMPTRAG